MCGAGSYRECMVAHSPMDEFTDRAVVAAIAHDDLRVWLLESPESEPLVTIVRPSEKPHRHVRQGQFRRMHSSETMEPVFFRQIEEVLGKSSKIVLVGHGRGKGNTVERFMAHLARARSPLLGRVVGTGVANLPALSDAEIIAAARERWSVDYL